MVATLAAQIELLRMPKREIEERFTKSELYLLGWRSMESAFNMEKRFGKSEGAKESLPETVSAHDRHKMPLGVPRKFVNKAGDEGAAPGDLDLRKATGPEALAYLRSIGMNLPVILPDTKRS